MAKASRYPRWFRHLPIPRDVQGFAPLHMKVVQLRCMERYLEGLLGVAAYKHPKLGEPHANWRFGVFVVVLILVATLAVLNKTDPV